MKRGGVGRSENEGLVSRPFHPEEYAPGSGIHLRPFRLGICPETEGEYKKTQIAKALHRRIPNRPVHGNKIRLWLH